MLILHMVIYIYITLSIHPTLPSTLLAMIKHLDLVSKDQVSDFFFFSRYVTQGQLPTLYGSSFLLHEMRMIVVSTYPIGLTSTLNELI